MNSSSKDNTEKPRRSQLKHVLLDVNFLSNPKIRALKKIHKPIGVLVLIDIYSAMSRATNATICYDATTAIIDDGGIEKPEIFIAYCLEKGLIQPEGKGYSNSQVIKDQEQYFKKLNSGKKSTSDVQKCSEKIQESTPPDTDYDNDIDLDKKNSQPRSKFADVAESSLTPADDPRLQSSNQFINLGRRPLRKYPEIHLSAWELADILEQYESAGIPIDDRKIYSQAFKNVAGKIKTKASGGEPTGNISAYNWLIGFAKTDLLREYRASLDLKRSETYLEKAKQ